MKMKRVSLGQESGYEQRHQAEEQQLRQEFRGKHAKAVNLEVYKQQLKDIERSFGALLLQPTGLTVGASGAVFGLMGAAIIVVIVLLSAGIGFWQKARSDQAVGLLRKGRIVQEGRMGAQDGAPGRISVARHRLGTIVKAATHHQVEVRESEGRIDVRVVVDV